MSKKQQLRDSTLEKVRNRILQIPVATSISEKLFPFQVPHLQNLVYALNYYGMALDASDTGVGKTHTACAVGKVFGMKLFIVTPKAVVPNWFRTGDYHNVEILGVVNYETLKNGKYYRNLDEFYAEIREDCNFCTVEKVEKRDADGNLVYTDSGRVKMEIKKVTWDFPANTLIIFDEAHKGKNGLCSAKPSANSKLIVSIKPYLNKENRVYGLFLSATITDKVKNLDVILYIFGMYRPYLAKSYKLYLKSLGQNREVIFKKIHNLFFPTRGSRIKIADLPEGVFKNNDVKAKTYKVSPNIANEIEDLHRRINEYMEILRQKGMPDGLGYIIRCWQKIESLKSALLADLALDYLAENKSVVIFINYSETKNLILDHILASSRVIIDIANVDFVDGDQGAEERDQIIERFQNDEIHLLICQMRAGGVGISFHDINGVRQRVALLCPTWNSIDLKQALGRIFRASAKSDAIQRIVYCTSEQTNADESYDPQLSIEQKICENINEKLENIDLLNDDDLTHVIKI